MVLTCEQYANDATTTLASNVALTDTTITVTSIVGFPTMSPFRVMIDDEIMLVTNIVSNVFDVTRGLEDTIVETHTTGNSVSQVLTSGGFFAFSGCRFATGSRTDLPTPELPGRIFLTQSPGWYLYRENGAAWNAWGPIFQLYEGLNYDNNSWNWINENDGVNPPAGLTNQFGDLVFSVPPNTNVGENVRLFIEPISAAIGSYELPNSIPYGICNGPDSNLWITDLTRW